MCTLPHPADFGADDRFYYRRLIPAEQPARFEPGLSPHVAGNSAGGWRFEIGAGKRIGGGTHFAAGAGCKSGGRHNSCDAAGSTRTAWSASSADK